MAQGETGLYITLSETADELDAVAESHGWSMDGIAVFELANDNSLDPDAQQSVFHPSEVELGETTKSVMERVNTLKPLRVVFDSLSEMRLLAQNPLRYRRQILALKQFFSLRDCTVLLLDDKSNTPDQQLHSIAHGVISLEQIAQEFGKERRRVNVIKMRGTKFRGGYHDYILETGGLKIFPRLIAAEHNRDFHRPCQLDRLDRFRRAAGRRPGVGHQHPDRRPVGHRQDHGVGALPAVGAGTRRKGLVLSVRRGPGDVFRALGRRCRWTCGRIRTAASWRSTISTRPSWRPANLPRCCATRSSSPTCKFIVIDSLNAYLQAMPGEHFLTLQMHELLSYLNQQGVTTVLVLGQHGLIGEVRSDVDLSYLSDTTVLLRFFESNGKLRRAITVIKSRTSNHALTIHELKLGSGGIAIGGALEGFEGILTGLPTYRGATPMMLAGPDEPR